MSEHCIDYDTLAASYQAHRRLHPGVYQQLIAALSGKTNPRVLEVGCGTGNYATGLQEATGYQVSGIDPSAEMLTKAAQQGQHLRLQEASAESFSFPGEQFDFVYSVDVIHHVGSRPAFFQNAIAHLAPGGQLVTVTDSRNDINDRIPLTSHFPETVAIELDRYPSIETLVAEMVDAGFSNIHQSQAVRRYELTDIEPYRARAYSSLLLIPDDAWQRGLRQMEDELAAGPIQAISPYTLLWGSRSSRT